MAPLVTPASAQDTARLTASLKAIAEASDNAARREAIVAQLETLDVEPVLQSFGSGRNAGTNIVVTLKGRDARTMLLGAHYDRVAVGQGAVDNGAACAALIEVIAAVKALPLQQLTLQVVFFDREENGLRGSRAFFDDRPRVDYAMNVDVFAYGDSIFATGSHPDGLLLRWLRLAGKETGLPVRDVPRARYPASDHQTMMNAGVETIGVALLDPRDIESLARPGAGAPRILTIIHSPNDTLAEVRPEQMARGIKLIEQLVRILDRAQ